MPDFDGIKKFADEHDDKVDEGLEKAGKAGEAKFGHDDQVDKGVDWAQQHTGSGDTQDKQGQQAQGQEAPSSKADGPPRP